MVYFDPTLQQLQARAQRLRKLEAMLHSLRTERAEKRAEEQTLAAARSKEERDVEKLAGGSLAAAFYALLGKRGEKLSQEQAEAYAAAVKHQAVQHRLAELDKEIAALTAELEALAGSEEAYQQALAQKADALRRQNSPAAAELCRIEAEIAGLAQLDKEAEEALAAGRAALHQINAIHSALDSASNWGAVDLIGGGLLATMAKHSHLDNAQREIEQLQHLLSRFHSELADIRVQANIQAGSDGFLRFADYLFDGLFVDWLALDHINRSQECIRQTKAQVHQAMTQIFQMQQDIRAEADGLRQQADACVVRNA